MTIKLTKTEDGYTAADTKYLKNIEIKGCSGHWKLYSNGDWQSDLGYYGNISRLSSIKDYIANYDANHEAALLEEQEEQRKLDELMDWRVSKEREYNLEYPKLPSNTKCKFSKLKQGDVIDGGVVKWGLGKENHLGEVVCWILSSKEETLRREMITGSYSSCHYDEPETLIPCLVEKVCYLSNDEYDYFINNFMDDGVKQKYGLGKGGTVMDHECEIRQSLKDLVTVVTAPNRRSVFVNCDGYDYARYVGVALSDGVVSKYNNHVNLDEVA
ncbi:MAG: hypothetical protein O2809_06800 [Proteobacteria bacterium]|nr:hypothetical protein [Pseudomonadota bacterium]